MADIMEARSLAPFGAVVERDLSVPFDEAEQAAFKALVARHKLLVFRNQRLSEDAQVRVMGYLGDVLGALGEYRTISSDGNLGGGPLAYHSDLSFTAEPFKLLSLHALAVNDGQSWTRFANGVDAARRLPAQLAARIAGRDALAVISLIQSHRSVAFDPPAFLPQQLRPAIIPHPVTVEPILYVTEMQTARIDGLDQPESDALLDALFALLYAPGNVYEHRWHNGDIVIWDNLALQHARCDVREMRPRTLQRVAVADKSFFELCPQFDLTDPRIAAWGKGDALEAAE